MKNILDEVPDERTLTGRFLISVNFVSDQDIRDKTILDIGCGFGWCEVSFLKRGARHITGIEISEVDLDTIRKNITDERLTTMVASAIELPFPDESFDTVVSWEVIEHIPKGTEESMFAEVARVLKPGGTFYLSTPHASFWAMILDPAWWLIGHRHYSGFQLTRYAKKTGFHFEQTMIRGGWWNIFSILNMYATKWLLRKWMILGEVFVRNENREYEQSTGGFTNIFAKFRKK
jgi:SAM-dependent methyltransferase